MALLSGADLVLEMPVFGSVASAEDFASCGVFLAAKTRAADFLSFGSESGDLKLLERRPPFTRRKRRKSPHASGRGSTGAFLAKGWAKAFLRRCSGPCSPTDILACEYLRAIKSHGSSMLPVPVVQMTGAITAAGEKGVLPLPLPSGRPWQKMTWIF